VRFEFYRGRYAVELIQIDAPLYKESVFPSDIEHGCNFQINIISENENLFIGCSKVNHTPPFPVYSHPARKPYLNAS